MLDIRGENVKLWVNEHENSRGKWNTYAISISKKDESGNWLSKPMKVYIPKSVEVPEGIRSGTVVDFEGFPTLDVYTGRDGQEHREIMIVAQKIDFKSYKSEEEYDSFEKLDADVPF